MPLGTERPRRQPFFALFALAVAATMISACAYIRPVPPSAPAAAVGAEATARVSDFVGKLANRDRSLVSMETGAIMEYSAADRHVKAREQISVMRPASLRVEAMSPFGVALILTARGGNMEIFEPSENKFIRAAASATTLERFVQIPMAPADAVTLLLGIAPDTQTIAATKPYAVDAEGDMTVASWRGADTTVRQIGFDDGNLAMVREYDRAGAIVYEVRYGDYHDIGGVMFPYQVDADFPIAHSHLSFRYQRPIVNGKIPDSVFELSPPAGAQQATLAQ